MTEKRKNSEKKEPVMVEQDDSVVTFEAGLERLEALVAQLESGDLALESALGAYEAGMGLVRALNAQLTAAETRIEILTRGPDGALQTRLAGEDEL
jgi:exodeoxyribonuclease VII small subunit